MKGGEYIDPTPLVKWIAWHPDAIEGWEAENSGGPHNSAMRTLRRAAAGGQISFCAADQLCVLLGVHMSEVFGDVYWTARCDDSVSQISHRERYHADAKYRERHLAQSRERKRRRRELREAA